MNIENHSAQLSRVVLKGFKSIGECELDLQSLNILIGANGAGKSNFIGFFRMIQQILDKKLQYYVGKQGGPDSILHFGRKKTPELSAKLYFGHNGYLCRLEPTQDNRMMFAQESFWWDILSEPMDLGAGHFETMAHKGTGTQVDKYVLPAMKQWRVYHFHDTGEDSPIKQPHKLNDNGFLRPNAQNLAAYLYLLKEKNFEYYQRIVKTVHLVAPFFEDFFLHPSSANGEVIELEWLEKGQDIPFKAHYLSDGTLRFICLSTVLLQPGEKQPETILIDEPELGLHPYAIKVLAALMKTVSKEKQLIISTQSVELIDEFNPEDIVVVDRVDSKSSIRRLDPQKLKEWIEEYSLGELWKKNILGGRPSR